MKPGFSMEDGLVVIRMVPEDYNRLLIVMGMGIGLPPASRALALVNRMNEGNPHYTPYEVGEDGETT